MDMLLGLLGVLLIGGLFWLIIRQVAGAQGADNRNSNPDQSSYTDPPPSGPGY